MKDCKDSRRNRSNKYISGVGVVKAKKVPEVIPIRSKEEQENTLVRQGAALVLIPKKMIKKIGKAAQLKAQMIKNKKIIRKIMMVKKMRMEEKIAKVQAKNLIDF